MPSVRQVMTRDPIVLDADATVGQAARAMRARDVGDVLVRCEGALCGIVTDRDLVVRVLACAPQDCATKRLRDVCTGPLQTVPPDADVEDAIRLMREKAIRRIPVVDDGQPIGIVSLGDLALARDRNSALGDISAAPPTR